MTAVRQNERRLIAVDLGRPNSRRKPRCHSTGERSAGAWARENLGSFFGLVTDFRFSRLAFIEGIRRKASRETLIWHSRADWNVPELMGCANPQARAR